MRAIALEDISVSIKPDDLDPHTPCFISVWYEISLDHKLKRRRDRFILRDIPFDTTLQEAYARAIAEVKKRENLTEEP